MNAEQPSLRLAVVVPLVLIALICDAVTWFVFVVDCGIGENFSGPFVTLCGKNTPQLQVHLPALGALVCVAGAAIAWRRRSYPVFVASVALGLLAAIALWAFYGDPAGHFNGILK